MAAPKNNQFWKMRSKHGRDKIFESPEIMLNACYEFFEYITTEERWNEQNWVGKEGMEVTKKHPTPFTMQRLCMFLDVNTVYFAQFKSKLDLNKEIDKDFSKVITHVEEIIYSQKFEGAATGFFNANIIARDLGLKDQTIHEIEDKRKSVDELFPPEDEI